MVKIVLGFDWNGRFIVAFVGFLVLFHPAVSRANPSDGLSFDEKLILTLPELGGLGKGGLEATAGTAGLLAGTGLVATPAAPVGVLGIAVSGMMAVKGVGDVGVSAHNLVDIWYFNQDPTVETLAGEVAKITTRLVTSNPTTAQHMADIADVADPGGSLLGLQRVSVMVLSKVPKFSEGLVITGSAKKMLPIAAGSAAAFIADQVRARDKLYGDEAAGSAAK